MNPFLETDRVILRHFTEADVDLLYDLNSDPEVMRYLNDSLTLRDQLQDEVLPRYLWFYETYEHFGYWAAIEKRSQEFLGWFLFRLARDSSSHFRPGVDREDDVELGYRLKKIHWGQGYATEVSRALVTKGFDEWEVPRVVASAMAGNVASWRVMEKVGLRQTERYFDRELTTEVVRYALTREQYLALRRQEG